MKKLLLLSLALLLFKTNAIAQKKGLLYDNWSVIVTTNDRNQTPKHPKGDPTTNFTVLGTQWDHRILTYFFSNTTPDITTDGGRQSVRDGLALWEAQTDLRFVEVCSAAQADIVLLWAAGSHGDGAVNDFDGPNGVLAHAFAPPPFTPFDPLAGDVHFDEAETWTTTSQGSAAQPIDLVSIAAHEIGHALGLDHTTVAGSLMEPFYSSSHRYLGSDDIAGIQSIYGAPGSNSGNNLINGTIALCLNTTATYSVPNPPAGFAFSWSSSDPTVATINASTGVATSIKSGTVTFTATASTGCGSLTLSKRVTVGIPSSRFNASVSLTSVCYTASNSITFTAATPQPGVSYNTEFIEVSSGQVVESIPGSRFTVRVGLFSNGTTYNVVMTATNPCGTSTYSRSMTTKSCPGSYQSVTMYPNPATSSVDFTTQEPTSSDPGTATSSTAAPAPSGFQVSVYDSNGQLRWQSATRTRSLHFDSSRLPRGFYGVVINENGAISRLNLSLE